jgi:hypothetical protein
MAEKYLIFNPLDGQYIETFDESQIPIIQQDLALQLYNKWLETHPQQVVEVDESHPDIYAPPMAPPSSMMVQINNPED